MKGSTLHRSGLTRENMGLLANLTQQNKKSHNPKTQLGQYYRAAKNQELDLLWNSQKHVNMHSAKSLQQKSPATYLLIGFVSGVLFMCAIILIVSISTMASGVGEKRLDSKSNVAVIGSEELADSEAVAEATTEKYIVKKGDTLNGIGYKFYGKYDESKIQEIQKLNNITNPASLSVGQELLIPVSQER